MKSIPHFEAVDIRRKVSMKAAIGLMKSAFAALSDKSVVVPLRTVIESKDGKGVALFMPSYSSSWNLFGLKMVSVFPGNTKDPVVQGKMLVMDGANGKPLALLDAASVTALRTGAASGLATDLLANKNASSLAVFGTGAQAWSQVEGILAVRKIEEIMIKGTSAEKEERFCQQITEVYGVRCKPLENFGLLKKAHIVCTATTSFQPLFTLSMLAPGTHINAVGSFKPEMREIGSDVMCASKLIVDQREAVLSEAGDVMIPIKEGLLTPERIHAELGELVSKGKQGRSSSKQITVFKSVGNAVQDLAIANYLINGEGK